LNIFIILDKKEYLYEKNMFMSLFFAHVQKSKKICTKICIYPLKIRIAVEKTVDKCIPQNICKKFSIILWLEFENLYISNIHNAKFNYNVVESYTKLFQCFRMNCTKSPKNSDIFKILRIHWKSNSLKWYKNQWCCTYLIYIIQQKKFYWYVWKIFEICSSKGFLY